MKKKIFIGIFSLLILATAIFFIVSAISSYNYDIKNYPDDKWVGFGSAIIAVIGGFAVIYELDLFYNVYYFLFKPKTKVKSILNVLANLSLLLIPFTDYIAKFFSKYISEVFREEGIVFISLVFIYFLLRIICFIIYVRSLETEDKE